MAPPARRRVPGADSSSEIEGLSGDALRAVASLWKRTRRELSARFGGSSMLPTIPPDGLVQLRCGDPPALHEIVAYVYGDQLVVHRVVGFSASRGWLLTRGDAHAIPDLPLADAGALVGRVVKVLREGAWQDPPGPPRSWQRSVALALCLAALRLHPALARLLIRCLRFLRRLARLRA